jgi:hypothetical protein
MLNSNRKSLIIVIVPLVLSAFIHLWNPTGFPALDQDEGHYLRRAMQVIQGLGPQESEATYFYPYDHPYFGQIFLAAALSIVNYPNSINPTVTPQSIEMLYMLPRVLMGILAVFDTFLVYKIADTRYDRKVAFVSATLFAVLPSTWFFSRIILDSISLPFILLSILFAVYYAKSSRSRLDSNQLDGNVKKLRYLLLLLSGIFLGLAIFTKLPIFTLIPLIVYIILNKNILNSNNNKNIEKETRRLDIKSLGIWFIPVLLIPLIWPGYAVLTGHLGDWLDGVVWQANRADRPFEPEMKTIFLMMDPVVLLLGAAGFVYAVIKKDFFILLWGFPYLIFIYLVNWVYFFHIIPVIAVFCIGGTVFLSEMAQKFRNKLIIKVSQIIVFSAIIVFGFVNSTLLITQNLNDSNFKLAAFVTAHLPDKSNATNIHLNKGTLIGPNGAFTLNWIPLYIFNKNFDFKWFEGRRDYVEPPIPTKDYLMIIDWQMRQLFSGNSTKEHIIYVSHLYNSSNMLGVFPNNRASYPDIGKYPYTNIRDDVFGEDLHFRGIQWSDKVEVKGNYPNKSLDK